MDFSNFTDNEFAAWVAGFTDGEGYIGVEPTSRKGVSCVRIIIANCVPEVLYAMRDRLGYGSINSQKQREHWRERFTWGVSSLADSERFINMVRPYLTVKAAAADAALERIAQAKANHAARVSRNEAIMAEAKRGDKRVDIAARHGISPQLVSRITVGHDWPSGRKEFASTRQRNEKGLFLPLQRVS